MAELWNGCVSAVKSRYCHNFSDCNAGWHLWRVAGPSQTRKDERVDTEERRERDVSISWGVASGRFRFFLDFFAFLTFSLSASLSFEYSSKLLLCCSSQDNGNAVAIFHWARLGYSCWPKNYRALSSARSNGKNYHELSCRIWTCPNCMIVGDSWW